MSHDPRTLKPGDSVAEWFDGTYLDVVVVRGEVQEQALSFVRAQNYLDYGHGAGVAITTEIRNLPTEPLQTFFVEAAGVAVVFRNNGTSWAWDGDGMIVGTDALLHGTAGTYEQTPYEESWMPVPVPVVQLPALAAATVNANPKPANTISTPNGFDPLNPAGLWSLLPSDGTDTPARSRTVPWVVEPRNEIVPYLGRSRSLTRALVYDYALDLGTNVLRGRSRSRAELPVEVKAPATALQVDVVVPEVAQYGQNVSPPVSALQVATHRPIVAPDGLGDPHWESVTLLMPFDETWHEPLIQTDPDGPFTFDQYPSAANVFFQAANTPPYSSTAQPIKFGAASLLLDGGYLYAQEGSSINEFRFEAGDLTVEFWIYPQTGSTGGNVFALSDVLPGSSAEVDVLTLLVSGSTWTLRTLAGDVSMGAWQVGVWQHVAITRHGTSLRLFVNGLQLGTTITDSTNLTPSHVQIGGTGIKARLDELRVTKGVARYTQTFTTIVQPFPRWEAPAQTVTEIVLTPVAASLAVAALAPAVSVNQPAVLLPTSALQVNAATPVIFAGAADSNYSSVSLLLPFIGANASQTFTDYSRHGISVSAFGESRISDGQAKHGSTSGLLDGQGDYLAATSAALAPGTGDFAVETWVYPLTDAAFFYQGLVSFSPDTSTDFTLFLSQAGLLWREGGADRAISAPLAPGTWSHVAVTRSNGVIRTFVNGAASASTYASSGNITSTTVRIGHQVNVNADWFYGYLDDLRITIGVARYSGGFTPPSALVSEPIVVVRPPATGLSLTTAAPVVQHSAVVVNLPATSLDLATLAPAVAQAGSNAAPPVAELVAAGIAPAVAAVATDAGNLSVGLFPLDPLFLFPD